MKYHLNTRKLQQLWEKISKNELDIADLKKYGIIIKTIQYFKDVYSFPIQDWVSYYDEVEDQGTSLLSYIFELEDFPEKFMPFIQLDLITRTEKIYIPTLEIYLDTYVEGFDGSMGEYYWNFYYIIRKDKFYDKYYLFMRVNLRFVPVVGKFTGLYLPLEFKIVGTFHNPEEYNEISSNKS